MIATSANEVSDLGLRSSSSVKNNCDHIVRRSTLIVPANVERFVTAAKKSGADAIMLDLEDGVAPGAKDKARANLREAVSFLRPEVKTVLVRVNNENPVGLISDLLVAADAKPDGIFIPKIESAAELIRCDAVMIGQEIRSGLPVGSLELAISLETPKGILEYEQICRAAPPRVHTIAFGSEDIAMELNIDATEEGLERLFGNSIVVLAAAAYHMQPLGLLGDLTNYKDLDLLLEAAQRSFAFGFLGSYCIHPTQVPVLNKGFTPSDDEIRFAENVLNARDSQSGRAQHIDRRMVATSAFRRSDRLLKRLKYIRDHEENR